MSALHPDDSHLLDAVRNIRWPARRLLRNVMRGEHLSRNLGLSAELSEYRPYRKGDEIRRIDWKLLARTNRAFVRLAQEHSQNATMLLLDASVTMAWPLESLGKWQQARRLAMGLAAVVHQSGDPVGLMVVQGEATLAIPKTPLATQADKPAATMSTGKLHQIAARTHFGVVRQIASLSRQIRPQGSVELAQCLARCKQHRLVVIGDFLDSNQDNEHLVRVAAQFCALGKEVIALHVLDDAELNPPQKATVLHDPEAPERLRSMNRRVRQRYLQQFGDWRQQLAQRWQNSGARYVAVRSSEDTALLVRRIVNGMYGGGV